MEWLLVYTLGSLVGSIRIRNKVMNADKVLVIGIIIGWSTVGLLGLSMWLASRYKNNS